MRHFFKICKFIPFALAAVFAAGAAATDTSQPVFIVLYTRFYDHGHPATNNDRIRRLLPLLEKLRAQYPDSGLSGLFGFSGSMSRVLQEQNSSYHVVDQTREAARKGLIDIGYTGEDEPSYLNRPKPDLLTADTPEKRWTAMSGAAERFLTDFKDPITGSPFAGLTGGLKYMQEVFGDAAFIRGVSVPLGGDSAITHEVQKLNAKAMMMGIPASDVRRGIEAYGFSVDAFSKAISPDPNTSPEVFWQDGALRLSEQSTTDNLPHSTDEPLAVFKRAFGGLNRTKVRVIAVEFGSYKRYLMKRTDGSVIWDPMEWMYYHPDQPQIPQNIKFLAAEKDVDAGYANEEAVLNWLLGEFLPANPGSRFLSISDLRKMAGPDVPPAVGWGDVKALAADLDTQFKKHPIRTSDYLRAGDRFFSNAEAFELMVEGLAADEKNGSPPDSLKPIPMWGPITVPNDMGPIRGSVTVRDVLHSAALLAPSFRNTDWKVIPDNAVPAYVETGGIKVNSAQFLRLMAWACQDLSPDKVLTLSAIEAHSDLTFRYPRNTPTPDQGMGWTLKPAPLQFASLGVSTADR